MEVDEKFARYILALQKISELEIGVIEKDEKYRKQIEHNFPKIKREREDKEFNEWIQKEKIEKDPKIKSVRKKIDKLLDNKGDLSGYIDNLINVIDTLVEEKRNELERNEEALRKEFKTYRAIKKMGNFGEYSSMVKKVDWGPTAGWRSRTKRSC